MAEMDQEAVEGLVQAALDEENQSFAEATCSYLRIICYQLLELRELLKGHTRKMGDHPSSTGPVEMHDG